MKGPITSVIGASVLLLAAGCAHHTATARTATTIPTNGGQAVVVTQPSASPVTPTVDHTLTGTVSDVDRSNGTVKVETPSGKIEIKLPPVAAATVHEGDHVTVNVLITPDR